MKKILVTGGAGFIGAHIVRHLMENTDWEIFVLDRISYAGSLQRLKEYADNPRLKVLFHDFRAAFPASILKLLEGVHYVIHNGAETHVERSLQDARVFVESNVMGTLNVLEACKTLSVEHYLYVSTDEVFGPAPVGVDYTEYDLLNPSNPYSATKAAGEHLSRAYAKCFKLPVTVTRTMNLFGERQHPEKFVPMTIRKVLHGEEVTIHGTAAGVIGSRKWIHARNQADALLFILRNTEPSNEIWHIAGEEKTNLEIASFIAWELDKNLKHKIVDFHSTRPGHDLRYSLSDNKLKLAGWKPPVDFEKSLKRTIEWTVRPENKIWLEE